MRGPAHSVAQFRPGPSGAEPFPIALNCSTLTLPTIAAGGGLDTGNGRGSLAAGPWTAPWTRGFLDPVEILAGIPVGITTVFTAGTAAEAPAADWSSWPGLAASGTAPASGAQRPYDFHLVEGAPTQFSAFAFLGRARRPLVIHSWWSPRDQQARLHDSTGRGRAPYGHISAMLSSSAFFGRPFWSRFGMTARAENRRFSLSKRPVRPCRSAIQNQFTGENAKAT